MVFRQQLVRRDKIAVQASGQEGPVRMLRHKERIDTYE